MIVDLELGQRGDEAFARAFAAVPRDVRRPPYDRFLSPEAYWERQLGRGGDVAAFWIARSEGKPVGRIGATVSPTRPGVGYVGFFEATDGEPAVARALLDSALGWLREHGVERAYGPVDRNTWYGYRFRVAPNVGADLAATEEPFSWEPWQPPSYVESFLAAGFEEAERYYSHGYRGVDGMRLTDATALVSGAADLASSQGYKLVPFSADWAEVLPDMFAVGNVCFAKNFLFEPIAWDDFVELYGAVGPRVDYRPSSWLVSSDGEKKGFMFAYVDRGYVVMKTVGVAPELRRGGLSLALLWAACDRGVQLGLDGTIGALLKEANASEGLLRTGFAGATAWRHYYAVYGKAL